MSSLGDNILILHTTCEQKYDKVIICDYFVYKNSGRV